MRRFNYLLNRIAGLKSGGGYAKYVVLWADDYEEEEGSKTSPIRHKWLDELHS